MAKESDDDLVGILVRMPRKQRKAIQKKAGFLSAARLGRILFARYLDGTIVVGPKDVEIK